MEEIIKKYGNIIAAAVIAIALIAVAVFFRDPIKTWFINAATSIMNTINSSAGLNISDVTVTP